MSVEHVRKTVHLVRHPETSGGNVLKGWQDYPLSPEGLTHAQTITKHLVKTPVTSHSSSDLMRALVTAQIISNSTGGARHTMSDLRERGFGSWEGRQISDLEKEFGKNWTEYLPDDAEPYRDFSERVIRGFNTALEKAIHLKGDIIIVTHGGPIIAILEELGVRHDGWATVFQMVRLPSLWVQETEG